MAEFQDASLQFSTLRKVFGDDDAAPEGVTWVAGTANIFQVAPDEVGLMLNLRRGAVWAGDLEAGNDIVILADPDAMDQARRFRLNRGGPFVREEDGRAFELSVYPAIGGFMPLGTVMGDGRLHPGSGTGFCISAVAGYNPNLRDRPRDVVTGPNPYFRQLLQQFRYDGSRMEVVSSEVIDVTDLVPGFSLRPGLKFGVVDGDDILLPLFGHVTDNGGEREGTENLPGHWQKQTGRLLGISRWSYREEHWKLADFNPIEGMEGYFEPSMVRDADGSLLLTARGLNNTPQKNSIEVWRSSDGGRAWEKVIDSPGERGSSPVSVGVGVAGEAYILGCLFDSGSNGSSRRYLCLWPLSADRRSLCSPFILKDTKADFGLLNDEFEWWADHPLSETVIFRDGRRRSLLTCRVVNVLEIARDLPPTEYSGTWIAVGA